MRILGIDTTSKFLALGIYDQGKVCEYNVELGVRHSRLLMPAIKRILDALAWRVDEINYLACGLGPGSFTGIRLGLATIKGLSYSLNKLIIGISTLDILAQGAQNLVSGEEVLVPAIDAKRGLIYCSIYKIESGCLKRKSPYMLLSEDDFLHKVKDKAVIFGDAVNLYKEKILKNIKRAKILESDYWYPKGRNIISIALDRIKAKKFTDAFRIKPIYLYAKECQIKKA
jgi:tRNA threonylcarbamoyl adenosine modification protein YeaZ